MTVVAQCQSTKAVPVSKAVRVGGDQNRWNRLVFESVKFLCYFLCTVHIRRKEICVYPDEDQKPSQGEGLNKRARVKLDGTWPVDKSTREPIKA